MVPHRVIIHPWQGLFQVHPGGGAREKRLADLETPTVIIGVQEPGGHIVALAYATTLTFLRLEALAFAKAQRDAAQTMAGLFRELAEEVGRLPLQEKIIAYFRKFLPSLWQLHDQGEPPLESFRDFIDNFDITINNLE